MKKPEKQEIPEPRGIDYGECQCANAYNQGRADMDAYRKWELEQKADIGKLAFAIKDNKHPALECITRERRNEFCFDMAQIISKMILEEI